MSEQHSSGSHDAGSHDAGSHAAGDHGVHLYEGVDIEEGNAPVPKWYLAALLILGIFGVCYMVNYMSGVQPSAVKFKQ